MLDNAETLHLPSGVTQAAIRCADRLSTDTGLIRACAVFNAIELEELALFYSPDRIEDDDERERALAPLDERRHSSLSSICEPRAVGLEDHRARAASLALFAPDLIEEHDGNEESDTVGRLLAALLRDLIREAQS